MISNGEFYAAKMKDLIAEAESVGVRLTQTGRGVRWESCKDVETQTKTVADVKEQYGEKWTHIDGDGDKCKVLHIHNEIAWVTYYGEYEDNIIPIEELRPIKPTISESEAIGILMANKHLSFAALLEDYDVVKD